MSYIVDVMEKVQIINDANIEHVGHKTNKFRNNP